MINHAIQIIHDKTIKMWRLNHRRFICFHNTNLMFSKMRYFIQLFTVILILFSELSFADEIELDRKQIKSAAVVVITAHIVNLFFDSECKKHVTMEIDISMLIERMVNEFNISNREELKNSLSTPRLKKDAEYNIGSVKKQVDRDSQRRAGGRNESCQRLVKYFESEHKELYSKWVNSIDTK